MREIIQVLQTVTPSETHFIATGQEYMGILSFWLVALVRNADEQDSWIGEFPIVANGILGITEQIQDDNCSVFHWSEMRGQLHGMRFYSAGQRVAVIDLLAKLWQE